MRFDVLDWPRQGNRQAWNRGDELKKPKIALGAVKPIKPHCDIRALPQDFLLGVSSASREGGLANWISLRCASAARGRDLVRIRRE